MYLQTKIHVFTYCQKYVISNCSNAGGTVEVRRRYTYSNMPPKAGLSKCGARLKALLRSLNVCKNFWGVASSPY